MPSRSRWTRRQSDNWNPNRRPLLRAQGGLVLSTTCRLLRRIGHIHPSCKTPLLSAHGSPPTDAGSRLQLIWFIVAHISLCFPQSTSATIGRRSCSVTRIVAGSDERQEREAARETIPPPVHLSGSGRRVQLANDSLANGIWDPAVSHKPRRREPRLEIQRLEPVGKAYANAD
jgi:hypothetical protein